MRQFISYSEADRNGMILISGKDFRYLRQVLRIRVGDMVSVRFPDGSLKNTTVCEVNQTARTARLQLCSAASDLSASELNEKTVTRGTQALKIQDESDGTAGIEYFLLQYIPKPVKMEQIVRQAVECGVKYIIPVIGEFSQKSSVDSLKASAKKAERIEKIIRESRQQSGSPIQSIVTEAMTTEQAVDFWKKNKAQGDSAAVVLWERNEGSRTLKSLVQNKNIKSAALAVGSEGGISPSEIELLNSSGFATVHFEGNILRCETAAVFGLAALQTSIRNENE